MAIYLDYNATTPVDPAVLEAMLPYLRQGFGNPSSSYALGLEAHDAVETARTRVADLLDCEPDEVVFTGGGSEADNLALKGFAEASAERGTHLVVSRIEHPAVLETCRYLVRRGFQVTYLPVDSTGLVDPDDVRRAIGAQTILVSIMHANNEVGTIQPLAEIAAVARERGVVFHTDAAQSVGKVPTRVADLGVDLLTVAGHKLYAPKGVGALYVRRGVKLESLIHGAGHESGRRAGTENVAGIVALGQACAIASRRLADDESRLRGLRDRLHGKLASLAGPVRLNGHETRRLPNTLNISFVGLEGRALLAAAPEVAASTGSACHSGRTEPSPVLTAMGVPEEVALGAVRLSVGRFTSEAEVERAADLLVESARRLRSRG